MRILEQTYFNQIKEILIVDANSQDNTLAIIESLQEACGYKIKVLQDPKDQRSSGLNYGIKHATGDYIIRIDARAIIPPNYVESCITALLNTGADNAGGIQKPVSDLSLNIMQQAIGLAMSHPFGVGKARFRLGNYSGPVDSVYLGCFKRELFNKIGLFDEDSPIISEDSDLNYRIRQAQGVVYLDSNIVVHYVPRERVKGFGTFVFPLWRRSCGFCIEMENLYGFAAIASTKLRTHALRIAFF